MPNPEQIHIGDKKKIAINGKESASNGKLPEDIRLLYKKALRGKNTYKASGMHPDFKELYNAIKATIRYRYSCPTGVTKTDASIKSSDAFNKQFKDNKPIAPQVSVSSLMFYLVLGLIVFISLVYYLDGNK